MPTPDIVLQRKKAKRKKKKERAAERAGKKTGKKLAKVFREFKVDVDTDKVSTKPQTKPDAPTRSKVPRYGKSPDRVQTEKRGKAPSSRKRELPNLLDAFKHGDSPTEIRRKARREERNRRMQVGFGFPQKALSEANKLDTNQFERAKRKKTIGILNIEQAGIEVEKKTKQQRKEATALEKARQRVKTKEQAKKVQQRASQLKKEVEETDILAQRTTRPFKPSPKAEARELKRLEREEKRGPQVKPAGLSLPSGPGTALDVLEATTAPIQGLAGAALAVQKGKNPAKGFAKGFGNKDKPFFSDVLKEAGLPKGASIPLGLALDIVSDPLTYTVIGTPSSIARGVARQSARKVTKDPTRQANYRKKLEKIAETRDPTLIDREVKATERTIVKANKLLAEGKTDEAQTLLRHANKRRQALKDVVTAPQGKGLTAGLKVPFKPKVVSTSGRTTGKIQQTVVEPLRGKTGSAQMLGAREVRPDVRPADVSIPEHREMRRASRTGRQAADKIQRRAEKVVGPISKISDESQARLIGYLDPARFAPEKYQEVFDAALTKAKARNLPAVQAQKVAHRTATRSVQRSIKKQVPASEQKIFGEGLTAVNSLSKLMRRTEQAQGILGPGMETYLHRALSKEALEQLQKRGFNLRSMTGERRIKGKIAAAEKRGLTGEEAMVDIFESNLPALISTRAVQSAKAVEEGTIVNRAASLAKAGETPYVTSPRFGVFPAPRELTSAAKRRKELTEDLKTLEPDEIITKAAADKKYAKTLGITPRQLIGSDVVGEEKLGALNVLEDVEKLSRGGIRDPDTGRVMSAIQHARLGRTARARQEISKIDTSPEFRKAMDFVFAPKEYLGGAVGAARLARTKEMKKLLAFNSGKSEAVLRGEKLVPLNKAMVDTFGKEFNKIITHEGWNRLLNFVDRYITFPLKTNLTVVNPQHHMTNFVGDTVKAWVGGVSLNEMSQAMRVIVQRAGHDINQSGRLVRKEFDKMGKIGNIPGEPNMTWGQLLKEAETFGGTQGGMIARELGGRATKITKPIRKISTDRENVIRFATYYHARKQGLAPEEAAEFVANTLIDYGDLSVTEREFARRIFPFYTFYARNTPQVVKLMTQRPGRIAVFEKIRQESAKAAGNMEADWQEGLNDFEKEAAAFPLFGLKSEDGMPLFINPRSPFVEDVLVYNMNPQELAKRAFGLYHPIGALGLKLFFNYDPYFERALKKHEDDLTFAPGFVKNLPGPMKTMLGVGEKYHRKTGKMVAAWNPIIDTLFRSTPFLNLANKLSTAKPEEFIDQKLYSGLAWLTGAKIAPFRPDNNKYFKLWDEHGKAKDKRNSMSTQSRTYRKPGFEDSRKFRGDEYYTPEGLKIKQTIEDIEQQIYDLEVKFGYKGLREDFNRKKKKSNDPYAGILTSKEEETADPYAGILDNKNSPESNDPYAGILSEK